MNNNVPEFVETIAEEAFGEVIGMADDESRFGIYANRLGSLETRMALRKGYVVREVNDGGFKSDYKHQIQFVRMGFDE